VADVVDGALVYFSKANCLLYDDDDTNDELEKRWEANEYYIADLFSGQINLHTLHYKRLLGRTGCALVTD
jgi:hypothetical protein